VGHLQSVERMAQEAEASYLDVLHQLSAVQGALLGIRKRVLAEHLHSCLRSALAEGRSVSFVEDVMAAGFGRSCRPKM